MKQLYAYDFPRPALTADVVLFRNTGEAVETLLIKRGKEPFLGWYALPGGFVNQGETPLEAAVRELYEETGISVDAGELLPLATYGNPGRDPRGWVVSVAFWCELDYDAEAQAGDDAAAVEWVNVDAETKLAFDHTEMIWDAAQLRANALTP